VGEPLSGSARDNGAVEQGDVVFSTSLPATFQGQPEDDWTLDPRHAPLIIGGQVRLLLPANAAMYESQY
jgi:hypothetical protein